MVLCERKNHDLEVILEIDPNTVLRVYVTDASGSFELDAGSDGALAMDMFRHPYVYLDETEHTVPTMADVA